MYNSCEAKGACTEIHLIDHTKITVTRNLQVYESLLEPFYFFRVHHAHLVCMNYIKEYIKGRGGHIIMIDNTEILIATRKKEEFLKRILH